MQFQPLDNLLDQLMLVIINDQELPPDEATSLTKQLQITRDQFLMQKDEIMDQLL